MRVPLPPVQERLFPCRAAIQRKVVRSSGRPVLDPSGGRQDNYGVVEPGVRCNVTGREVFSTETIALIDAEVDTVVLFPDDVHLSPGDTIRVTDEMGNVWPQVLTVIRYQRLGIYALRRWRADCKGS